LVSRRERRRTQRRSIARGRRIRNRRIVALAAIAVAGTACVSLALNLAGTSHQPRAAGRRSQGTAAARNALLAAREQRAIDRALTYTSFIRMGVARRREVALTFDDGPGPYTPAVLRVLRRLHAPATFFGVGFMERWFSHSTVQEVANGHVIGDHTATHRHMGLLSPAEQRNEVLQQADAVGREGAPFPRLFRPPFGSFNASTLALLRGVRMLMVLWSVDTADYRRPGSRAIVDRALAGARPGAIILLHDAGGDRSQTVAALPLVIRGLRHRHLRLVTVPRLVLDDPPPHGQALPARLAGD
jgi:peptidoglycan/xylan/chitin deacetylase (PgdA/CDA1 family)